MRIWDIIDTTQPGIEITSLNEKPVRIASAGTKFFSIAVGVLLATTSAFCMPVPRQAVITSAQAENAIKFNAPPLEAFFAGEGFTKAEETELLSKLNNVTFKGWSPSSEDIDRAIASNLSENPGDHVAAQSAKLLKRRKLA